MSMYLLLVAAAILYSVQFIFNQKYEKRRGNGCDATLLFQMNVAIVGMLLMLILNGFQMRITMFSLMIALWYAVDILLYIMFSMKAFGVANLSVYSIFAMLGGMMLPFVFGIAFYQEGITVPKLISCVLIAVSLGLTFERGEADSGKEMKYYMAVFVFNGMMGVISKIHQSNPEKCTDSNSFMVMVFGFLLIISLVWYVIRNKKVDPLNPVEYLFTSGYAVCNGLGELFCLLALTTLPASVQFPMITGGVIFFSAVVSGLTEKKQSRKGILSVLAALAATIIIVL